MYTRPQPLAGPRGMGWRPARGPGLGTRHPEGSER